MPFLDFEGKSVIYSHHLRVPFRSLQVDKKKSFSSKGGKKHSPSLDDNLIIHGDNLHALKALLPRYSGKIKCIYIDPPYNTGNEGWKYNDNVNSPQIKEWLNQTVGTDDLERHEKWLCMMWPRLQLLKELLSDDGVIFISIDDNEQFRLMAIMNEIFGEENFLAQITAQTNPRGRSLRQDIAQMHEYILVFSKNFGKIREIPKPVKTIKEYNKKDENGKFRLLRLRNSGIQFFNKETRPNLFFPIYVDPPTGQVSLLKTKRHTIKVLPKNSSGKEGCWTWSKAKIQKNPDLIVGVKTKGAGNGWRIYRKDYLPDNGGTTKEKSLWLEKNMNHEVGKEILRKIFHGNCPFEFPKSVDLIKKCIIVGADKNSIILDSFAGSGTTAQAVLDLNKEDGGNRKFILVECEGYADKITAERVRRVIKGVPKATDEKLKKSLGGSFTYCTLGEEINTVNLLKGKKLPDYKQLAEYVFYTATGKSLSKPATKNSAWFIGETELCKFHLIYKPDIQFLRSKKGALNLDMAEKIKKFNSNSQKTIFVFAPETYMEHKELKKNYNIVFCHLPYAIHKIMGL